MIFIDVLINLPTNQLNQSYTYHLPEDISDYNLIGKRVLIKFGNRRTEGFVISANENSDEVHNTLPIIKILDEEPIFDLKLLELARWMADYYVCPVSLALKIMIPGVLQQQKELKFKALITREELNRIELDDPVSRNFLIKLIEKKTIGKKAALEIVSDETLKKLQAMNLIIKVGRYKQPVSTKFDDLYLLDKFDEEEWEALRKRAPRQAEIMAIMRDHKTVEKAYLDQKFNRAVIKILLQKGYIKTGQKGNVVNPPSYRLNEEQITAVKELENAIKKQENKEFLLWGVTGSGKTEVYIHAVEECLRQKRGAIILLPEIALTRQMINIFSLRFAHLAILHSNMTPLERYSEWKRIKEGSVRVVLGARSAIFAPVEDLGLIIIDEEQETSYKQEETPRYHAREVARKRAVIDSAVLLMGSATPSLESFYEAMQGKIQLLTLQKRIAGAGMPVISIDDLRKNSYSQKIITPYLANKINSRILNKEQVILFINRRGYSPRLICPNCGYIFLCPACSVAMVYHLDINQMVCHYCNYSGKKNEICPICKNQKLSILGVGTQRIEQEIRSIFPEAKVYRLDMDNSRKKDFQKEVIEKMQNKEIDILIGTQMVAKGFDFPEVSLVGILDVDGLLSLPDFRAGERGFQLILQASGRAGRADKPGEVIIQTYNPDNKIIQLAVEQNYIKYVMDEIKSRKLLEYPPFTEILRIVLSSKEEKDLINTVKDLSSFIEELLDASEENIQILGPAPCAIFKIRNRFRYHIIVKSDNRPLLNSVAFNLNNYRIGNAIRIEIDFNPLISM